MANLQDAANNEFYWPENHGLIITRQVKAEEVFAALVQEVEANFQICEYLYTTCIFTKSLLTLITHRSLLLK